jgi:hypothetical protein
MRAKVSLYFLIALLLASLHVTMAGAADLHSEHVFFDNSAADHSYYHSAASVVSPSELEIAGGKCPVESERFVSPHNSLRLKWRSASGGDWRLSINAATHYGRRLKLTGDELSFWCYAPEGLSADNSPRFYLQDAKRAGTPSIPLLARHGDLPAGKWTQLRFPAAAFAGQYQGTEDSRFDLATLTSLVFVQNLDDNAKHTLLIDDIHVGASVGISLREMQTLSRSERATVLS